MYSLLPVRPLQNLPEYAVAFHACAIIGGIITPLNPLYQSAEIAHQLKDSCAKFLLTVTAAGFGGGTPPPPAGTHPSRLVGVVR